MTSQRLGCQAPELIALCRSDEAGNDHVVGWVMVVAERVVAYVPGRPGVVGSGLLSTYSSLDSADQMLGYAGIYPVQDWSALLGDPVTQRSATTPITP